MPKPQYPTQEGLWSKGMREEKDYQSVRLGTPYPEAVAQLRQAYKGRNDFDPAVLFVWGTMQATAVLNILKAAEKAFGKEGQELVRKAINQAGYNAMDEFLRQSDFPENIDKMELASYIVTGINTVLYASLEKPWLVSDERCEFDILWCPHQDRYTAFDCRVQRYFVEGMFKALEDNGKDEITAWVERLIPHGDDHCHFVVERRKDDDRNPWHTYSDELGERAFKKLEAKE